MQCKWWCAPLTIAFFFSTEKIQILFFFCSFSHHFVLLLLLLLFVVVCCSWYWSKWRHAHRKKENWISHAGMLLKVRLAVGWLIGAQHQTETTRLARNTAGNRPLPGSLSLTESLDSILLQKKKRERNRKELAHRLVQTWSDSSQLRSIRPLFNNSLPSTRHHSSFQFSCIDYM